MILSLERIWHPGQLPQEVWRDSPLMSNAEIGTHLNILPWFLAAAGDNKIIYDRFSVQCD